MKNLIIFFLFSILGFINIFADSNPTIQKLRHVGSVSAATCLYDSEGKPCSKIFIYTNIKDIKVISDFIIGEIQSGIGQISFYVSIPENENSKIKISCEDSNYDIPLFCDGKLLPREAYAFDLYEGNFNEDSTIPFKIETQPSDAQIYIDDIYYGKSPLSINLIPGNHVLTSYKPGFKNRISNINVSTLKNNHTLMLTPHSTGDIWDLPVCGQILRMIYIKGGDFSMGTNATDAPFNQQPSHNVHLTGYWISESLLSNDLAYALIGIVTDENMYHFLQTDVEYEYGKLPFFCRSIEETDNILFELNKKSGFCFELPSEAQWEFAAKGADKSKGYKYSGTNEKPYQYTYTPSSIPNEIGIFDMSCFPQLCKDRYQQHWYKQSPTNNPVCNNGDEWVIKGIGTIPTRSHEKNPRNFGIRLIINDNLNINF